MPRGLSQDEIPIVRHVRTLSPMMGEGGWSASAVMLYSWQRHAGRVDAVLLGAQHAARGSAPHFLHLK